MRFFAYFSEDAETSARVERILRGSSQFRYVSVPTQSRWVVAHDGVATSTEPYLVLIEGDQEFSDGAAYGLANELWSERWLERLRTIPVDFTAVSVVGDRLRAVRAAAQVAPLYLYRTSGHSAIASRLGDIARFVPAEAELDPLINAVFSSWYPCFIGGRALLKNTQVLGAGEAAFSSGIGWNARRWWEPTKIPARRPTKQVRGEHGERLRSALLKNLGRSLAAGDSTLVSVSGGVDSSILVALAARQLDRVFSTVSFLPAEDPEYSRSKSYIDPLLSANSAHVARRWEFEFSVEQNAALLSEAPRELFHVVHPVLCVLPRVASAQRVSVLCGGEFCDDLFGSWLTLSDWARASSLRDVLSECTSIVEMRRFGMAWFRLRARHRLGRPHVYLADDLPRFIKRPIREEYREWLACERRRLTSDPRPRVYLARRVDAFQPAILQNWEVTSSLGIRRAFPFLSRELLELAFECNPVENFGPGTKKLVRTSLRGLVPERNLERQDKERSVRSTPFLPWRDRLPDELECLIRADWLEKTPKVLPADEALQLRVLVNIVETLRNIRSERRASA